MPFPSPGDLPDLGIEPRSPTLYADALPSEPPGKSLVVAASIRNPNNSVLGKLGLKLNTQETKIIASGPITTWEIDGETVETVSDFIFLGSKITADGDCSHEIKRHSLEGKL